MFHVELRQFPRNSHAFNLSEGELHAGVLTPWKADRAFELAGQRWRPDEARLTILEGPRLEPHELSMGRGWTTALKRSQDVTAAMLAAHAPQHAAPPTLAVPGQSPAVASEPEGFAGYKAEVLERSVEQPLSPREVWRLAARWLPSRTAGERLTIAERVVRELLAEDLVALGRGAAATAADHPVPPADLPMILHAWETWAEERPGLFLCATPAGASAFGASSAPPA